MSNVAIEQNKELNQAIADLRKVVETNPNRDRFPLGTVIRWTAQGRYTYAAIKTEIGWFTTARPGNPFVKSQMDYEELLEVLGRAEVTNIAVATSWSGLDGSSVPDHGLPMAAFHPIRESEYTVRGMAPRFGPDEMDDEPRNAEGF